MTQGWTVQILLFSYILGFKKKKNIMNMIRKIPHEIWIQKISSFLELKDLVVLRRVCKFFNDSYQVMYFLSRQNFQNDEVTHFERKKNKFLEDRKQWTELREKLSCEQEKDTIDQEFYDEFWHGIGSESWTGHTTIEQTKGGSAHKISDEECFTSPLNTVLSYDCTHCNREHHQMLRIAIICGIDIIPRPKRGEHKDFNEVWEEMFRKRYENLYSDLMYSTRVRYGYHTLFESFSDLMEYILIANSLLDDEKFDYATQILYQILGIYELFRSDINKQIKTNREIVVSKNERLEKRKKKLSEEEKKEMLKSDGSYQRATLFLEKLEILRPFSMFRRLLRICLYYGADIYKPVVFSPNITFHQHKNVQINPLLTELATKAEESCVSRTLRTKDDETFYFQFLVTRGHFLFPNETNMGFYLTNDENLRKEKVDVERLILEILGTPENPKRFAQQYSLIQNVKFWKKFFLLLCEFEKKFEIFGKYCGENLLFEIVRTQNRKFLKFLCQSEELCEIWKKKERESDGESLFSYACGRRGKMWKMVRFLIKKGWDLGHQNRKGETGLMKAIMIRNCDTIHVILEVLREKGVKVSDHEIFENERNEIGESVKDLLMKDSWLSTKLGLKFDEK